MSKFTPFSLFVRQCLLYPLDSPFLPDPADVKKDVSYAAGQKIGELVCPEAQGLPKTGQTEKYLTGDDGDFQAGWPIEPPRFIDNGDGTITDRATGLMWIKDPSELGGIWGTPGNPTPMIWEDAVKEPLKLKVYGHEDWRLPNIRELMSIVDYGLLDPAIDLSYFPNISGDQYWSATTTLMWTGSALIVDFYNGFVANGNKAVSFLVLPVRGGPHLSP